MIKLHSSRKTPNMPETPKLPIGIKNRRRDPDEWDKTIVAFESPYRLRDMALPPAEIPNSHEIAVEKQQFKIRLAHSHDRVDKASILVQKMYSWRGYAASEIKTDPNRVTLLAYEKDQIVGTITVGFDSPEGLTVDDMYKAEVDQLRKEGRKVAEVTKLAVDERIRSKSVLAGLFHIGYIYSRYIHHCTDYVIEVNPRHALFYKRMLGFVLIGEERHCARVNAPAVLLRLDFDHADQEIRRIGGVQPPPVGEKSLYPYVFSKKDEIGITERLLRGE
jgi:hypothetical protein